MSNPDVKRTKEWEPWGPDDLISEWRENGVDEPTLNNVVQGLQLQPNGLGAADHKVTRGIAYIDGYRVKYDLDTLFSVAATTHYRFYAVLKVTADPSGGVSAAWAEVQMITGLAVDPPTDKHILLGIIKTGAGPSFIVLSQIWWHDNRVHAPEIFDASRMSYKTIGSFERPFLPTSIGALLGAPVPTFYYKMEEGITQTLLSYVGGMDPIIPDPINPYARPCKGRRGTGQLFDNYAGVGSAYRKSVNPIYIVADGSVFDHSYWFSIWAHPFRKDLDMSLMFKLYDFRLTWLTASNQLEFEVGDGAAAWTRSVLSQAIADFKNKWFHICFGYDEVLDKHWIIVNNGPVQWEVGGGVRAKGINDFYIGNNWPVTLPFYGIMDEFFKFHARFYRHHIEELYNYGVGNIYKINFDSIPMIVGSGYFANQTVNAGLSAKMDISGGTSDTRFFDFTNDKFVDPTLVGIVSGLYLVHIRTLISNPVANARYRIGVKSVGAWIAYEDIHTAIAAQHSISCTAILQISIGNDMEFWFENFSGSNVNLQAGTTPSELLVCRLR